MTVAVQLGTRAVDPRQIKELPLRVRLRRDGMSALSLIWAGPTVETADVEVLFPWLDWAFVIAKAALSKAA